MSSQVHEAHSSLPEADELNEDISMNVKHQDVASSAVFAELAQSRLTFEVSDNIFNKPKVENLDSFFSKNTQFNHHIFKMECQYHMTTEEHFLEQTVPTDIG